MHPDTAEAVRILQDRLRAAERHDFRRAERFEAALDDLVRNPDRPGPVGHLVRNATSYGRKRAVRRAQLAPRYDATPQAAADGESVTREVVVVDDTVAQLEVDLRDLVDRAGLGPSDRTLVHLVLSGATVAEVADRSGVPRARLDVRLSRARTRLRAVA
jgi:hypothetical protein